MNKIEIGNVTVMTNGVIEKTPEEYANAMMTRLLYISDEVGGPIRDQVMMFKDKLYGVLLDSVRSIQLAERERLRQMMREDI